MEPLIWNVSFDDINKIEYDVNQCEVYNLDVRQLRNKIKSNEYERIPVDARNKLKSRDDIRIIDFVKNHIHIRNSNKRETISEKILQKLILEDISTFLKNKDNLDYCNENNIKNVSKLSKLVTHGNGILIYKRENKFVIEYCSNERITVREYKLVWYN